MHLLTSTFAMQNMGLTLEQRFVKRALDLILSLLILIVLSPVRVTAVCIKSMTGGPSCFVKTVHHRRRIFKICKLKYGRNAEEKGSHSWPRSMTAGLHRLEGLSANCGLMRFRSFLTF
ncbi:MAG: sugar transferase [Clostridia bacterium]